MNKFIISTIALFIFASCGQERTADVVKTELNTVQTELKALQVQEVELKNELDSLVGPKEVRAIKVRVKNMQPSYFEHQIEVNGSVEARNSAYISPEAGGQIKKIHVKEGQRVGKGQLMMSLNAQPLRSQLGELKSGLKLAETIYEKQKELWDQKIGSEVQYLEAKNSKESLESKIKSVNAQIAMSEIRAPFSGIVDEIYSKVGELASPGQRMVDLVSLSQMEISAEVSEKHLQHLEIGDKVEVEFPNFPKGNTQSKISRKGNIINPANRSFKIVVPVPNPKEKIKPNQIATMRLRDYITDNALVIPSIIVRKDLDGDFIFVARNQDGKMKSVKVYITVGNAYNGNTEVVKGLKPGDNVLVDGYNLVRNGSVIEISE